MNTSKTYLIPISVAIILVILAGFVFFSPVRQNEGSLEEPVGVTVPVINLDTSGDEESLELDSERVLSSSSTSATTSSDEVNGTDELSTSTGDATQGGGTIGQLEFETESEASLRGGL